MANRQHIDDIFRKGLSEHEVSPSFKTWDNIQAGLSNRPPFYQQKRVRWSALLLLLGSIAIGLVWYNNTPHKEITVSQQTTTLANNNSLSNTTVTTLPPSNFINFTVSDFFGHLQEDIDNFSKENEKDNISFVSLSPIAPTYNTSSLHSLTNNAVTATTRQVAGVSVSSKHIAKSNRLNAKQEVWLANSLTAINKLNSSLLVLNESVAIPAKRDLLPNQKKIYTDGLYFGSFYGIHNSWILNNKALGESVNTDNLNYKINFGRSYGLVAGFDLPKNFGIQAEWHLQSKQGQQFTYGMLESKQKRTTEVNLTYVYVPIMLKYRFEHTSRLTKQPMVLSYLGGVQYGNLKSAEVNINNPLLQDVVLRNHSWGFVFGMDYDIYLTQNYFLSFGTRASLSTTSNNASDFRFPGSATANKLNIGVRASFNYRFNSHKS